MSHIITQFKARPIFDSRGFPTVEVEIEINNQTWGRGAAPSGASTGQFEAVEKRDKNQNQFYGKGVHQVCLDATNHLFQKILNKTFDNSFDFDKHLIQIDGTANKSKYGANILIATSIATAQAMTKREQLKLYQYLAHLSSNTPALPTPFLNIINGGVHAHNNLAIQEFMLVPQMKTTLREQLMHSAHVIYTLKGIIAQMGFATNVGDEGGFAPALDYAKQALDLVIQSIEKAGYQPGDDFTIALDVAANECYTDNGYQIDGRTFTSTDLVDQYKRWTQSYPITSIEDGLGDTDIDGWKYMTQELPHIQLVGDDLFVTQKQRLYDLNGIGNAVLMKPNQVGTLFELFETWSTAKELGYKGMASHRSGETEDVSLAHIAIATGCKQIKTGSLARTDRTAKYNELMRIEEDF